MRLSAGNLSGWRGGQPVFADISFTLQAGQAAVVTGPNGSGKSTLLRIIAGLLPAASGTLAYEDDSQDRPIGQACHYLGHQNAMKTVLSIRENLVFWRDFLGEPNLEIEDALERVGLSGLSHLPFGTLSTGQRRRIAIARLLIARRPVWLLDEPTAGLDRASETSFSGLMQTHLADGGIVVAATHSPLELEKVIEIDMGTSPFAPC